MVVTGPPDKPSTHRRSAGFTILELLVALTLAAAVVALAVTLKQTVLRAGVSLEAGHRDWATEQFLRSQLWAADEALNKEFGLVVSERSQLSFVTRKSAQYGNTGVPVLATYRIVAGAQTLEYYEIRLPPWWRASAAELKWLVSAPDGGERPETWRSTVFSDIDIATFSFWDSSRQSWVENWTDTTRLPRLLRLEARRFGGEVDMILESEALSYSLSSGP